MACIRKRSNKWQVQVRRMGFRPAVRSFLSRADAERWSRQVEVGIDRRDLPPDTQSLSKITIGDLLTRYKAEVTPRKRSAEKEDSFLNAFLRNSPEVRLRLSETNAEVFSRYRNRRLREVGPASVRRELATLQHVFSVAIREWNVPIRQNPVATIDKPLAPPSRTRRISKDEIDKLFAAAKKTRTPLLIPLFHMAIATGMRRGELLRLCWRDIDREVRTLHIPITKNGHPRTIPLSPEALAALNNAPKLDPEWVFPTTPNALRLAWVRLTKRAGVKDLHFHDLRHEAISRFFERGLSVPEVALISGHRDPRMLFRYTHLRAEDVAKKLAGNQAPSKEAPTA